MAFIMSSCQKKENVGLTTEGSVSIRFVDKNEINNPFLNYKKVQVFVVPAYEQINPEQVFVKIEGLEDNQNKFNTSLLFMRDIANSRSYYNQDHSTDSSYQVATSKSGGKDIFLVSSANNNIDERLFITKDDTDSLCGKFSVSLVDNIFLNTGRRKMEGYFSVAKKGRF